MNPKIKKELEAMAANAKKYPENRDYYVDVAVAELIITTLSEIVDYYDAYPDIAKQYAQTRMRDLTSRL